MKIVKVVAAVISQKGKILICNRPPGRPPYGWEFPGGKIEPGESMATAVQRELLEELSLVVMPFDCIYYERIEQPNKIIELYFVRCRIKEGAQIICLEGQKHSWVEPRKLLTAGLLAPDEGFARFLALRGNI